MGFWIWMILGAFGLLALERIIILIQFLLIGELYYGRRISKTESTIFGVTFLSMRAANPLFGFLTLFLVYNGQSPDWLPWSYIIYAAIGNFSIPFAQIIMAFVLSIFVKTFSAALVLSFALWGLSDFLGAVWGLLKVGPRGLVMEISNGNPGIQ